MRLLADEDPFSRRGGLQPGRGVHRVPHHGQLAPRLGTYARKDDLSGVHADTDAQSTELLGVLRGPPLNLKRGPHRTRWVILVGDWCPEHRHERIADDLVDRAPKLLHDLAHRAHAAVDHRADLLGIGSL
jgi:hypothetical protein